MSKWSNLLVATCVLLLLVFGASTVSLADYLVAPGDKLRVTVFQWPEYSGESQVDDNGNFSLPAVGRIPAAGYNVTDIEKMVSQKIDTVFGSQSLEIVVEVLEYRPISVLGAVESPGRYPYAVNTTVLEAIAMAGGFARIVADDNFDQHRTLVNAKERLEVLKTQRLVALVRRARLVAEQNDLAEIEFPQEVIEFGKTPSGHRAVTQEIRIFDLGTEVNHRVETNKPDQDAIHQGEIKALKRHIYAIDQNMKILEEELQKRNDLLDKGFARTAQVVDMRSEILDLKAERRRAILDTTRAKRVNLEADHNAFLASNQRKREIAMSLSEVEARIATLDKQIATQESFLKVMGLSTMDTASTMNLESSKVESLTHSFSIIRSVAENEDAKRWTEASGDTKIQPGDIIMVNLR